MRSTFKRLVADCEFHIRFDPGGRRRLIEGVLGDNHRRSSFTQLSETDFNGHRVTIGPQSSDRISDSPFFSTSKSEKPASIGT